MTRTRTAERIPQSTRLISRGRLAAIGLAVAGVALLAAWPVGGADVESGRSFWAFRAPVAPEVPAVRDATWPRTDIDRFVLARLEGDGLAPVGDADRRTLIRRATFDLTGLPPSPEEVEAFVADESRQAFEKVVDRLLGSKRFGERWGRHWLDIARYGESTGRTRNFAYPHAWRYRDWVIDAFNDDMPYDRFIVEQIAGDLLPDGDDPARRDSRRIATGFLALGTRDLNERNAAQYLMDTVDEQIDVTTRGFLALTVSCARCHDHKFDPIPTTDYYALAGIFRSTEVLAGVTNRGRRTRYVSGQLLYELESPQKDAESPAADEGGSGDAAEKRQIERRLEFAQRRLRQLRGKKDAGDEVARLRVAVRRGRAALKELEESPGPSGPVAMGVREGNRIEDCRVHVKGEVSTLGDVVPRGLPQVLVGDGKATLTGVEKSSGRLELARWIASAENPLTARVLVNRVWHHLFGRGIVATVDNFGETGERPSHPELLDHLATRFVAGGWSVKSIIREIMLSRVYALGGELREANHEADPDNVLVWRMSQRRLEIEGLRDAMLAVSGQLDLEPPSGPLARLPRGEIGRGRAPSNPLQSDSRKRTVYLPVVRGVLPEMLEVFDFPDPCMLVGDRDVTTVATQALFLMNDPFVIEQSRAFARLLIDRETDARRRVDLAYRRALARPPTDVERKRALEFVKGGDGVEGPGVNGAGGDGAGDVGAWAGFCQALLASAEFRYVK